MLRFHSPYGSRKATALTAMSHAGNALLAFINDVDYCLDAVLPASGGAKRIEYDDGSHPAFFVSDVRRV